MGFITNTKRATGGFRVSTRRAADTRTPAGLYNLAVQSGLQGDADRVLEAQKGEETKKIFSGGFISDVFDVLNSLQYGVTGVLKGKGFMEGVRTRQSFSDKDALGDNGIPGVIAGIGLDIAVDPLTYIAPWTIAKKIPMLSKLAKGIKGALFGKMVPKTIKTAEGLKKFQQLEGGTRLGKYTARKLAWMSGADPVFKETWERGMKNTAIGVQNLADITKGITRLAPQTAAKILTKDKTGRIVRVPLTKLKGVLSPEEFETVATAWNKLDDLGKEAVNLKLLSKGKFEENFGEYMKNAYLEYEQKKGKGIFRFAKKGVKRIKARKIELTPERMKELGQIDNPAYLIFKSTFDLFKDIENTKLFKEISKKFGSNKLEKGLKPIFMYGGKLKFFKGEFKPAEDILRQIELQNFSKGATVPQVLEQSFTKVGKAIQFAEESGLNVSKLTRARTALGKATLGGIEKGGVVKLRAFISDTIAHELGHSFDVNLSKIINTKKKYKQELSKVVSFMGLGGSKRYQRSAVERFAEFTSLYIHTPLKARELAPEFTKLFESKLLPQNKISNLVDNLSSFFQKVDKLPNIKTPLKELDNANYLETTIRKAFPSKSYVGVAKEKPLSYVPEYIADYVNEISQPIKYGIGKKLVADFKFFKVIMNPGTHARNIVSNKVLNWWKLGMNPLDPRTIAVEAESVKEIAKGGGKYINEAKTVGYNLNTFASQEVNHLLDSPEALAWGKTLGNKWGSLKKTLGNIYQAEENQAKLAAFIFNSKYKRMGIEDAWKAAESATFNYAQVTPFIRKLRESLFGFPFITFTVKATPIAIETALKHPRRVSSFGKIKTAIENQADIKMTDRERASEPPWIKDGFYIKLPMKDKHGRSSYFDLTYIIPFGDLVSGQFVEGQIKRDTGVKESLIEAGLSKAPALNFIKEISRNQDFYGNRIWKESDSTEKQTMDLFRHFTKTYFPPLVSEQIPGGYNERGERQQRGFIGAVQKPGDELNQKRTVMQEMLRHVGAKIQPMDADIQESYQEWNQKKALETLLREQGVLKKFDINYIPK